MKKISLFTMIVSILFSSNGFAEQPAEKFDVSLQQWYKRYVAEY